MSRYPDLGEAHHARSESRIDLDDLVRASALQFQSLASRKGGYRKALGLGFVKFLVDECLHTSLVAVAQDHGEYIGGSHDQEVWA
ncbi:hypothetical protein [Rhizobium mongolense]|uniref:hypothetical protein n=1 Tax=Rhizobium mongolense TaxID=57676 RepID=UPI003F5E5343